MYAPRNLLSADAAARPPAVRFTLRWDWGGPRRAGLLFSFGKVHYSTKSEYKREVSGCGQKYNSHQKEQNYVFLLANNMINQDKVQLTN
jgi:hypothetical protein